MRRRAFMAGLGGVAAGHEGAEPGDACDRLPRCQRLTRAEPLARVCLYPQHGLHHQLGHLGTDLDV